MIKRESELKNDEAKKTDSNSSAADEKPKTSRQSINNERKQSDVNDNNEAKKSVSSAEGGRDSKISKQSIGKRQPSKSMEGRNSSASPTAGGPTEVGKEEENMANLPEQQQHDGEKDEIAVEAFRKGSTDFDPNYDEPDDDEQPSVTEPVPAKRNSSRKSSILSVDISQQSIGTPPSPIAPTVGLLQLYKENAEKDRARKEEVRKLDEEFLKHKKLQLTKKKTLAKNKYIVPSSYVQMMKMSLRYVPGVNSAPTTNGDVDDQPYVFKAPGREIESRISDTDLHLAIQTPTKDTTKSASQSQAELQEQENSNVPKSAPAAFSIAWPTHGQPVSKAHENMLIAFLNYQKRKQEAGVSKSTLFNDDESLSGICTMGKDFKMRNVSDFKDEDPNFLSTEYEISQAQLAASSDASVYDYNNPEQLIYSRKASNIDSNNFTFQWQ